MRGRQSLTVCCALVVLLVVGLPPASATGVRYVDHLFEVGVTKDITYGAAINSSGQLQSLELDLYEPLDDTDRARGVYVWAHGGNFNSGTKEGSGPLRDYAARGWLGISIEYRVRPELVGNALIGILTNPDQIENARGAALDAQHDMQAAVRWVRANAEALGADPNAIAVGGISAGAITALATAFNPNDVGTSGSPGYSSAVTAAVSHSGAYVPGLQGGAPAPGAPPVAMYHGTNDPQVPIPLAPIACVLTLAMLNTCELVTFVSRGHTTLGTDLAADFLYRKVILRPEPLDAPLVATSSDPITALAGAAVTSTNTGVAAGVVVPTDPNVYSEELVDALEYIAGALGVPLAL